MSVEVVFETHSTSVDNERGLATGWLPGSEHGKRQAEELGRRRRGDGLGAAFTSDLARAGETVEIAFAGSAPLEELWPRHSTGARAGSTASASRAPRGRRR